MERSTALNILIIEKLSHTLVLRINQKRLSVNFYLFLVELPVESSSGLRLGSCKNEKFSESWDESLKALYVLPAVPRWAGF